MMYFKQISPIGCFLWTIILVWLFFALKLYYVVIILLILGLAYNLYQQTKLKIQTKKEEKERNFEPEIGEVYKVCQFCGNDVKRSVNICPHCKNKLD